MPNRKVPMGVGSMAAERKGRRVCEITGVSTHEEKEDGSIKPASFIVCFIDDGSTAVRKVTEICRLKEPPNKSSEARPAANNGIKRRPLSDVTNVGSQKSIVEKANESDSNRSCSWLRANKESDPQFNSLNLQLVMCDACEAGEPAKCQRRAQFIDIIKRQRRIEHERTLAQAQPEEEQQQVHTQEAGDCLENESSCVWLRANQATDPDFGCLDLQLVMCDSCEAGNSTKCQRENQFIAMIQKQQELRKHASQQEQAQQQGAREMERAEIDVCPGSSDDTHFLHSDPAEMEDYPGSFDDGQLTHSDSETDQDAHCPSRASSRAHYEPVEKDKGKVRLSYDANHIRTRATGKRNGKVKSKKRRSFGYVVRSDTPTKMKYWTQRRLLNETGGAIDRLIARKCPNMSQDGRSRIVSDALNDGKRGIEKIAAKQLKSTGDVTSVELRQMQANAFNGMVQLVRDMSKKEQRPFLASLVSQMPRTRAEQLCGIQISRRQWKLSSRHAAHPGPFKPVEKVKIQRTRVDADKLGEFLNFVDGRFLQNHAYGMSEHTFQNGEVQTFDRVSSTADNPTITRAYAKYFDFFIAKDGITLPADEQRCQRKCPKNGLRCMNVREHKSRCRFTPPSMCSPSSIEKIIDCITHGKLKSLAGLDDEDVEKGHNNFKELGEMTERLSTRLQKPRSETEKVKAAIQNTKVFHDTSFATHVHREAEHICGCLCCGLSSPGSSTAKKSTKGFMEREFVPCSRRDNGSHKGPCKDCESSFEIFSTLMGYAKEAEQLATTAAEKEDFHEIGVRLIKRRNDLIELRSHKVRKKTESDFDRKATNLLKNNECTVVSDFKMKILSAFHREPMTRFYGKRGTACLGFMIITPCDECGVNVHYYLFFSNDTKQDANFVLSAKAALYTEILPALFPDDTEQINVHFRADGAGTFNCNLAKSVQHMWKKWTGGSEGPTINEASYRISVNGGGKTSLDGNFGVLSFYLRRWVDFGEDITTAEDCFKAFQAGPGMQGSTAALFTPVREEVLSVLDGLGLTKYHHVTYNEAKECLHCFSNSGFGEGVEIPIGWIEERWVTDSEGTPPAMPEFVISWQVDTDKSKQTLLHSTETKSNRDKKRQASKLESRQKAVDESWAKQRRDLLSKGIHSCSAKDSSGRGHCIYSFLSGAALVSHENSGKHEFRSHDVVDLAVSTVSAPGGIMTTGSRRNRLGEFDTTEVQEGSGLGKGEGSEWCELGCFLKPGRKPRTMFSLELKKDLLEFFLDGEKAEGGKKKGKAKYTKEDARTALLEMRRENGLRKYTSTSEYGPLPSIQQISGIFSEYKTAKNKVGIGGLEEILERMLRGEKAKPRKSTRKKDANEKTTGGDVAKTKKTPAPSKAKDPNAKTMDEDVAKAPKKKKMTTAPKKKKDPNAPKKPMNAYLLYANSVRAQVKKDRPDLPGSEIVSNI
ncbi:hypothetical protein ACHAWF_018659 [Thalassiosira exigua]